MQSEDLLSVNLSRLPIEGHICDIELKDSFFERLEQEEIIGGNVRLHVEVKAAMHDVFTAKIIATGEVVVACDRCLDPLVLLVDVSDEIKLRYSDTESGEDPDFKEIDPRKVEYDLSWDVYEIIETALPLQRVHEEGACNPEMESYILNDTEETAEKDFSED